MSAGEKDAVLLLAHGSPGSPEDVPTFLRNITGGRPIPAEAMDEVKRRYTLIGRSPLAEITEQQAAGLRMRTHLPVYVGMRNWKPYIAEVVAQMQRDGIRRAAAICMAPQNSRTSVGLYREAALAKGNSQITMEFVESWHDHPLLIRAFAEKLLPAWRTACDKAGAKVPMIFTAHSVPVRTIEQGDPYETQARHTAELVASQIPELAPDLVRFAFQSQGMSGGTWLGPTVENAILELKQAGHVALVAQPIGFLCDHVEVLYDIDIGFKKFAAEHGVELTRSESLNDSPLLADALAELAHAALKRVPQAGATQPAVVRA
jgi:protoporphyrin/coproporphyrin ferrochelatase